MPDKCGIKKEVGITAGEKFWNLLFRINNKLLAYPPDAEPIKRQVKEIETLRTNRSRNRKPSPFTIAYSLFTTSLLTAHANSR